MQMKKILGAIAVAGAIAGVVTPIIYTKQIDKLIQQETKTLKQQQIEISNVNNNDSFFKANREYKVIIKNITPIAQQLYPNINYRNLQDLQKLFNNTIITIKLNFLKYPLYHKDAVKIYLTSLNKETTTNLESDKIGKEILEFIKNKGLEVILDVNNINIAKAKLKNIDLTIKNANNAHFKITNAYVTFDNKIKTNVDNVTFSFKDNYSNVKLGFNNLINITNKKNRFNYTEISNIKNLFYIKNNQKLNIDNLSSSTKVSTIVNKLKINNNINIKILKISNKYSNATIKNLIFNSQIDNLDFSAIKKFTLQVQKNPNDKNALMDNIKNIINKGFSFKISPFSIDNAIISTPNKKYTISKIDLKLDTKLKTNKFNFSNTDEVLKNSEANLVITTTKKNIDLLTQINPSASLYLALVSKQQNNNVIINISYKEGKLTSNGKQLF